MNVQGAVCVVTGGAGGIGSALARRLAGDGAAGVVVVDLDAAATERAAEGCGGVALAGDVTDLATHERAVALAEERFGPVDVYCSNAGIGGSSIDGAPARWDDIWRVNVVAHALAARAVLPSMLERERGWLVQTASAAGLLVNLGDPAYTATKHAAVGLAEWLAATYRHRGIGVCCLCPMGVDTDMLRQSQESTSGAVVTGAGDVLAPDVVAAHVVDALRDERFLVLPHPEVADFLTEKVADVDRWLGAMNRVQQRLEGVR